MTWQKVQKCGGGGFCGIRGGRFGEVKWGLSPQLRGMKAYLGQGALRHKQLGSALILCTLAGGRPPAI